MLIDKSISELKPISRSENSLKPFIYLYQFTLLLPFQPSQSVKAGRQRQRECQFQLLTSKAVSHTRVRTAVIFEIDKVYVFRVFLNENTFLP